MGTDHISSLLGSALVSASSFDINHVMPSACFVCLSPRLDAVPDVPPAAMLVDGEGRAPYALRRGKLGAVPVGDVANALGGQGVAGVAASAPALDKAPEYSPGCASSG